MYPCIRMLKVRHYGERIGLILGVVFAASSSLGGINVLSVYTSEFLESSGFDARTSARINIGYTAVALVTLLIATFTIEKFGRLQGGACIALED